MGAESRLPSGIGVSIAVVCALVLASRIPFLSADPGADPDAWRIIQSARELLESGRYVPSRLPGYPVTEIASAAVLPFGVAGVNALTAALSAAAAAFFCLALRSLGGRVPVLAGAALAFVPAVYVNSTTAMDYVWALAFAMGALFFCATRRPFVAGLFLGLAIGCRITSAALVVPLGLVLWSRLPTPAPREAVAPLLRFGGTAAIVGAICFAPIVIQYGAGFLTFYENGYPELDEVVRLATVDVWGRIGLLAVAGVAFHLAWQLLGPARFRYDRRDLVVLSACLLAIIGYAVLYLRLPHESGYLIPIVPFVILLAAKTLSGRMMAVFALLLLASPFLSFGFSGIYEGPVITDHQARERAFAFAIKARKRLGEIEPGALVVVGSHEPSIRGADVAGPLPGDVTLRYFAEAEELRRQADEGRPIYYLRGMDQFEQQVLGVRLQDYGARELEIN